MGEAFAPITPQKRSTCREYSEIDSKAYKRLGKTEASTF